MLFSKLRYYVEIYSELPISVSIIKTLNRLISVLHLDRLIPDRYFLVNYKGGKIYLNLRESHMMRERMLGVYEYHTSSLFKKMIKPGMTIIDVGANKGYYSLLSAKLTNDSGRIISVEPHPENCKWLRRSIKANNYKSIEIIQKALFNKKGKMKLFEGSKSGHHSLKTDQEQGCITVELDKLDDLVREMNISKIDLMKIDVEGADLEVLLGGQRSIKKICDRVIVDIHDIDRNKLYSFFEEPDHVIYGFQKNSLIKLSRTEFIKKKGISSILTVRKGVKPSVAS